MEEKQVLIEGLRQNKEREREISVYLGWDGLELNLEVLLQESCRGVNLIEKYGVWSDLEVFWWSIGVVWG